MNDLPNSRLGEELCQRREIDDPDGVDQRYLVAGRELDDAQNGPEGTLEDELGVEGDSVQAGSAASSEPALDTCGELIRPVDPESFAQARSSRWWVGMSTA